MHEAVLALLAAKSFEHLIEIVTTDLACCSTWTWSTLCVEALDDNAPLELQIERGVQLCSPGGVDRRMGAGRTCCCATMPRATPPCSAAAPGWCAPTR